MSAPALPVPALAGTAVIVPGWRNSGPRHWQTAWESALPGASRVCQTDWEEPDCEQWVRGLDRHLAAARGPVVLVAHSLGCITIAHWAARMAWSDQDYPPIAGALLVAPADVERPGAPAPLAGFAPIPRRRLPFPSLVVASSDDPYCRLHRAQGLARDWGAGCATLPDAGHINAESGHHAWAEGLALLGSLVPATARMPEWV